MAACLPNLCKFLAVLGLQIPIATALLAAAEQPQEAGSKAVNPPAADLTATVDSESKGLGARTRSPSSPMTCNARKARLPDARPTWPGVHGGWALETIAMDMQLLTIVAPCCYSNALVTSSDALVTSSFLLLVMDMQLLLQIPGVFLHGPCNVPRSRLNPNWKLAASFGWYMMYMPVLTPELLAFV